VAAEAARAAAAIPTVVPQTGEKHASIILDGHKVGKLVEKRIMARNQIPSSTNDFDGRSGYVPVDMG
jgi:hypothetical protein